ncbi:TIGR00730 family Rossman fold protein [Acetobacter pomorum]|uniref:Cytokinin riboside 5'-monophosphate phosphoribohydrolase n=1 Tax=Acetobacter pomorum TaxID=65959 RepID=A0A2G4RH14_9PROT|nr:TIGR00730 family Rossman fold protein [Acetobacter pomorum]PHY95025.1 TIGR00730 family Rossman fold protein [Acetobacter pomorum]GBR51233.1 lysine decarboxylase [Acetobacter pomorum DSM 11825]
MTIDVRAVAVFCGSRMGVKPVYQQAAQETGKELAQAGIRLVYGGGANGLMGVVAHAVIQAGGSVTGVIPEFLKTREKMNEDVSELIVTKSMHERKQIMFARADAFWVLPGGFGTFEELLEILTWKQLKRHDKPIVLINVDGWGDKVVAMLNEAVQQGFASTEARSLLTVVPNAAAALECSRIAESAEALGVDVM